MVRCMLCFIGVDFLYYWFHRAAHGKMHVNAVVGDKYMVGPLRDPVTWYGINFVGMQIK